MLQSRLVRLRHWAYRRRYWLGAFGVFLLWYLFFSLPKPLFGDATSTVIEDYRGKLVGGRIADDGQWRFPYDNKVPHKFERCIVTFEDQYFYRHPGFNPIAFVRALIQDVKHRHVVSGGSTLTMQTVRLMRKGQDRTVWEKVVEVVLATRLELGYSKKDILALYASNAPFGGNVVGLDAASWRYFGRPPSDLSWAESATLAVLPNAPALIHPGRNRAELLAKRNRLLDKLKRKGIIDAAQCEVAKLEALPDKPLPIPQYCPHLLNRIYQDHKGEKVRTTIHADLQEKVNNIVRLNYKDLKAKEVFNAAAIVVDVETGNVVAYVGNTDKDGNQDHGNDVDVITAPRSTGSVLKPLLYASMLEDGEILPNTLVADIPTMFAGYTPKNYNLSYDGAVPAKQALSRSLNIPAVRMLHEHGVDRFLYQLRKLGLKDAGFSGEHYGLSLILGGAEGTLWDMTGIYGSMSRTLKHYHRYNDKYFAKDFRPNNIYADSLPPDLSKEKALGHNVIGAAPIWFAFDAMSDVNRPDEEASWQDYSSSNKIAWKTGTSFGYRDAWAIGTSPRYVVGVWVGNADGVGRPGLTGVSSAAPIMFDIFSALPRAGWFSEPYDDMEQVPICRRSGHRATELCEPVDSDWVPKQGLKTSPCPYHQLVHLDASKHYRVTSDCEPVDKIVNQSWFVLPAVQEYYYKSKDPTYSILPPYRKDCVHSDQYKPMELIYPKETNVIYIPIDLDQKRGQTVFQVAHRKADITVFWDLDGQYIGSTKHIHQMGLSPPEGKHVLTLVDEDGYTITKEFEVVGKKQKASSQ